MKFTLSWLKEFLDTNASLDQISDTLTAIGLEVESVNDPATALKDFIVAEILEAAPHPNASKLQVCKVSDGTETRQIVCGAPNARAGLKTVLAREGVHIPGSGITIKKTKIRDVESNGMLCSAEELGLGEASDGILELPTSAIPGKPAADAIGANDPILEINITPNRADCFGIYGIARDLAAAGLGTLNPLKATTPSQGASPIGVSLATAACPLFIGISLKGVKNGESPDWLKTKLTAVGLRPISALVDITNYFTIAYGRPLHVYDAVKLTGNITVREARVGETLKALNDKEYSLTPGMTIITDDKGVLGLGGIIGGVETGCTETTTDVFLEAAYFEPINIAQTGRKLELLSDARTRFERGVDAAFTDKGAELAAAMIVELCGGQVTGKTVTGSAPDILRHIHYTPAYTDQLGGVHVAEAKQKTILEAIGCEVHAHASPWHVMPPSWRRDMEGAADIVEEVLRLNGYSEIPTTPLPKTATISKPALNAKQKRVSQFKRALAARGMMEVHSWSFLPAAQAKQFGWSNPALKLANPISTDLDTMRPSLLPNLLTAVRNNQFRGIADVSLFEVGAQFTDITPEGQLTVACGLRAGNMPENLYPETRFSASSRAVDAFDAKADAAALIALAGLNPDKLEITRTAPAWYHPGRSGTLMLGKAIIGHFGEIHPAILASFDIKTRVSAFELFVDALPLPRAKGKAKAALQASAYQAVERDFAFTIDAALTVSELLRTLNAAEKQLITGISLFDVYSGKGVDDGKKSVAVKVSLQAADRTLSEQDIAGVSEKIIAAASKLGAVLRQ